jgi:hypothetical protein
MAEQISGTVTRVNGKGFQLAEVDGWVNLSKFAKPEDVAMPPTGARVLVSIDGSGFARKVAIVESPAARAPAAALAGSSTARETVITRLAVLNTATAMAGGGSGFAVDVEAVLTVAARLEAWATRST